MTLEIYQVEDSRPADVRDRSAVYEYYRICARQNGRLGTQYRCHELMIKWDYIHITTWNFLPFVLRRVGEAPEWVVKIAFALWYAGCSPGVGVAATAKFPPWRIVILSGAKDLQLKLLRRRLAATARIVEGPLLPQRRFSGYTYFFQRTSRIPIAPGPY